MFPDGHMIENQHWETGCWGWHASAQGGQNLLRWRWLGEGTVAFVLHISLCCASLNKPFSRCWTKNGDGLRKTRRKRVQGPLAKQVKILSLLGQRFFSVSPTYLPDPATGRPFREFSDSSKGGWLKDLVFCSPSVRLAVIRKPTHASRCSCERPGVASCQRVLHKTLPRPLPGLSRAPHSCQGTLHPCSWLCARQPGQAPGNVGK